MAARDGEWSVVATDVRYDLKQEATEYARGRAPTQPFELIALSPFAKRLVGATATSISIVNVKAAARGAKGAAAVLETMSHGHGRVSALSYSSDGLRVLSGGADAKLRLWRVEDDGSKAGFI